MATLNVVEPNEDAVDPGYVAAAGGGDQFAIDEKTVFHMRNASGGSITATFASQAGAELGIAPANKAIAVPAGANRSWRPGKNWARFRDANGRCQVTYSGVTTFTVAVERVP